MTQDYGAAQPIVDVAKKAYSKVSDMLGEKPAPKSVPKPAQQMNWKPSVNVEQKAQLEKQYSHPIAPEVSQRKQRLAKKYGSAK